MPLAASPMIWRCRTNHVCSSSSRSNACFSQLEWRSIAAIASTMSRRRSEGLSNRNCLLEHPGTDASFQALFRHDIDRAAKSSFQFRLHTAQVEE